MSCGVLSVGDSDYELARSLGLEIIEEKPYSPISDKVCEANLAAACHADMVVLADVDIGMSNIKNVTVLKDVSGPEILILRENAGDYTGGKAGEVISELVASGQARMVTEGELEGISQNE